MDDSKNISSEVVQRVVGTNDDDGPHTEYNESTIEQNHASQNNKVKNIVCFWTVGLCNGFGWTVMLSATYDILKELDGVSENHFTKPLYSNNSRECMQASPAVILLANTVPALITKIVLPFLPFYVNGNIILSCLLSAVSFINVALAQHEWQAIVGVMLTSICAALGDITMLAYYPKFIDKKNLLLAFSSGIGFSGVIASLSYAALTDIGFTPKTTLYLMLIVPLVEIVAFLFINESNAMNLSTFDSSSTTSLIDSGDSVTATETTSLSFSEKIQHLPKLMKYFNPLLLNYICEFIINQMFDLLYVPGIGLSHADQFRWMQVTGQIGSLVGRSSLSFFALDDVWPLNLLIVTCTMFFAYEAIYMAVPIIWIIFIFVFLVGFLSGCTVVSVFYRLTNETSPHHQVFAVCSVSAGITAGVIVAAILAIPMHSAICNLPSPF